jgi:WS/DGAT/MGAT family acyltransferase
MAIFSAPADAKPGFLQDILAELRKSNTFAPPFNYVLSSPKLRTLTPKWEIAEHVDLEYHLRHSALPAPGGERELGTLISRLHSNPLDFHRPLWEAHIIEGLSGNRFAMYTKMHHSLIDGIGAVRLMNRIFATTIKDSMALPAFWSTGVRAPSKKGPPPPLGEQAKQWWQMAKVNAQSLPDVAKALFTLGKEAVKGDNPMLAHPFGGPKSILNGKVSGARRVATQHYELKRVKALADQAGVSINDVLLAICSGSMRRYLMELNALPSDSLMAGLPVSVRPAGDDSGGNAISFISAYLFTDIADPLERLRAIRESTQAGKAHLQTMPKTGLNNYTMMLMSPMMFQLMTGLGGVGRPIFNLVISNVPGPEKDLYFWGSKLEQFYPISLIPHGQALNITVITYAGQFNLAFTGDYNALPHLQRMAVYTGEALEELESLVQGSAKPVGRKKKSSQPEAG